MSLEAFLEVLRLGLKNLLRNKLRTFLTMLGMIFGVGSVIAMLSVGAGARREILARIQELGIRNIIVHSVKPPEEVKPGTQEENRWFAKYGLRFGVSEHLGASFTWFQSSHRTDKDGPILGLLAAEMMATTGRDPGEHYADLTREFGAPVYERIDAPATKEQKAALSKLSPSQVTAKTLAGERIEAMLTTAPGNGAAIGGLKVVTANGWFAARPSGTEDVYKLYAESFLGADHLRKIQEEAQALIARVFSSPGLG